MTSTDEDRFELDCLETVARIGELPDGCSVSRYAGLEYVELRHGVLVLTAKGRQRCTELQAEGHRVSGTMHEPSIAA
jgi:hypothetical protein